MILLPKAKYEHLLRRVEEIKESQQHGGKKDDTSHAEDNDSMMTANVLSEETKHNQPPVHKMEPVKAAHISTDDSTDIEQLRGKHSKLYVEKPISKMKFALKMRPASKKLQKKRHWINYII